jgi:hypothetical protein
MGSLIGGGGDGGASKAARAQMEAQRLETEKFRKQAEEERRDLSAQQAAARTARARGGSRMLLSESRLNPEEGLDETLGA